MFVVGDDWQAINRFAGCDTDYFINFEEHFKDDNARLEILTNYRSAKNIIKYSNQFVKKNVDFSCNVIGFRNDAGDEVEFNGQKIKIEG